jgi:hypothetical protein
VNQIRQVRRIMRKQNRRQKETECQIRRVLLCTLKRETQFYETKRKNTAKETKEKKRANDNAYIDL